MHSLKTSSQFFQNVIISKQSYSSILLKKITIGVAEKRKYRNVSFSKFCAAIRSQCCSLKAGIYYYTIFSPYFFSLICHLEELILVAESCHVVYKGQKSDFEFCLASVYDSIQLEKIKRLIFVSDSRKHNT